MIIHKTKELLIVYYRSFYNMARQILFYLYVKMVYTNTHFLNLKMKLIQKIYFEIYKESQTVRLV